jgi:hypothetical protein
MERDNVAIMETKPDDRLTFRPNLSRVTAGPLLDPHYLGYARRDCFGIICFFPTKNVENPAMAFSFHCPHHATRPMMWPIGHTSRRLIAALLVMLFREATQRPNPRRYVKTAGCLVMLPVCRHG